MTCQKDKKPEKGRVRKAERQRVKDDRLDGERPRVPNGRTEDRAPPVRVNHSRPPQRSAKLQTPLSIRTMMTSKAPSIRAK
jgi:hypothetical protein